MSAPFLRQCLPKHEKEGQQQLPPQQQGSAPAWKEDVSSWRLGTMQDSLCELARGQAQLQRAVQGVAEMQLELRMLLQQSQTSIEEKLVSAKALPVPLAGSAAKSRCESSAAKSRCPSVEELEGAASEALAESFPGADSRRVQAFLTEKTKQTLDKGRKEPFWRRLVTSASFDAAMAGLIFLNFLAVFLEIELKALDLDFKLGQRSERGEWPAAEAGFTAVEAAFNVLFLLELLLRAWLQGRGMFRSVLDMADAAVTLFCAASVVARAALGGFRYGEVLALLRVTRLARAVRLLRFVRALRLMTSLGPLRVLVHTLAMSLDSLLWSFLVMGAIIVASGLLAASLVVDYLQDESKDLEERQWLFAYFGSATRASYTMFEATFSGIWASRLSRRMIEEVSPWFALFWVLYTSAVNFAVVRVVSALFLKRTLDVAQIDSERIALAQMEQREKALATIREIFRVADQSGDGVLTRWEFEAMLENNEVLTLFLEVDLEAPELQLLFNLLSQDDGVVDQDEFLEGAMKLKSQQVKLIDIIQLHHEQAALKRRLDDLKQGLEHMDKALHPERPWSVSWSGHGGRAGATRGGALLGQGSRRRMVFR